MDGSDTSLGVFRKGVPASNERTGQMANDKVKDKANGKSQMSNVKAAGSTFVFCHLSFDLVFNLTFAFCILRFAF